MSRASVIVRYDGPALEGHKMDVEDFAPAVMALADLCKDANKRFNGNRTGVNLFIDANVEQHCFEFKFEIVQTLFERAKSLIGDDDVAAAKEIFEWLGLSASSVLGLFGLLKILKGRKPDNVQMTVKDGRDVTQIYVGGNLYLAHPQAVQMLRDKAFINNAKRVSSPALKKGYDSVSFHEDGTTVTEINREDATYICDTEAEENSVATELGESTIQAKVKIRKAVYEGTGKWTIQYDKARDVSMFDAEWLERFQNNEEYAPPGSIIHVTMRVSAIELDSNDNLIREPEYAIMKVHGVTPPPKNGELFGSND